MGAGAWGTALAKVLADAGNGVRLWARDPERAAEINRTHCNPGYVDGPLPTTIRATGDYVEALTGACTVLLAVPSQTLRANLTQWTPHLGADTTLVSLAKGIELDTLMRMSQVVVQVTGVDAARVAVVTGPNLASEVAAEQPAATVIACSDSGRAVALQRALATGYFRPYTNADVIGAEIGGACKNVIALASGMAAGAGLGRTPPRPSSPAGWPRSCGSESRWAPNRRHWQVWPASGISLRRACPRVRATGPSESGWGRAARWRQRWPPPAAMSPKA